MLRQDATTWSRLPRHRSRPWSLLRPKKKASSGIGTTRSFERAEKLSESTLNELTPEEWRKKSSEIANLKPKSPELTPEQVLQTKQAFRQLPLDRKKLISQAMAHPCTYCEQEFNIPNIGSSHGICKRHLEQQYAFMKKTPPPVQSKIVDLALLSPEERQLAVNLFSIIKKK